MKVILTGVTGVVGPECMRLALKHPEVTEVVALARRPVSAPEGTQSEKLKSVVVEDFGGEYPEDVKEALKGADACIWNLAMTPTKSKGQPYEFVKKVCHDYTFIGLEAMDAVANRSHPFRFVYTSGVAAERDQSKELPANLPISGALLKMRGEVENQVLSYAAKSDGRVEAQVTKPGIIEHPGREPVQTPSSGFDISKLPRVHVSEIAAAELDQALHGFEKDTLLNEDLVEMGRKVLQQE